MQAKDGAGEEVGQFDSGRELAWNVASHDGVHLAGTVAAMRKIMHAADSSPVNYPGSQLRHGGNSKIFSDHFVPQIGQSRKDPFLVDGAWTVTRGGDLVLQ